MHQFNLKTSNTANLFLLTSWIQLITVAEPSYYFFHPPKTTNHQLTLTVYILMSLISINLSL